MDIKKAAKKLYYIILISFAFLHAYIFYPIINGVGCNYNSVADDSAIHYVSSCRFGVVETTVLNKITGEKKLFKGILAKKNNDLIFFVFYSRLLSKPSQDLLHDLNMKFSDANIYSAKQIHKGGTDWVLLRYPWYRIYKVDIAGKLGFW